MPLMTHEYVSFVTFVASKIVLRHPNCDASKNVLTLTVSEFDEILRASYISQDDPNGEIRFVIRDLENKLQIFNRNYNFVTKITILPFFQKLKFLGSYRQCTVSCTIWVTVHGYCLQTLFMGIIQKKKKKRPLEIGASQSKLVCVHFD